MVAFSRIPLLLLGGGSDSVSPIYLVLYNKDLKSLLSISALKLVASSFEENHKLPAVSE